MATRADVINLAHRRLGVLSADEEASADQYEYADDVLTSLFAELGQDVTISWDLDAVPDTSFQPLANLLAVDLAPHYAMQSEPRSRAWMRFRATVLSDDREDLRDLDEDGTVEDAEAEAWARARYF